MALHKEGSAAFQHKNDALGKEWYNIPTWGCTGFDGERSMSGGKPGRSSPVNNGATFKCQPH
jgi:hypothetical protein